MFGFQNGELAHGSALDPPNAIHRSNAMHRWTVRQVFHYLRSCIVLNRNGVTVSHDLGAAVASIVFPDFNTWRKFFWWSKFRKFRNCLWKQQTQNNQKTCMSVCQYLNSSFTKHLLHTKSDNKKQTTSVRSGVDFSVGTYIPSSSPQNCAERSGSHGSPSRR